MTFPTGHEDKINPIGSSKITHPIITFRLNLALTSTEKIGPKTNQRSVNLLHPDMHDSSPDRGRTNMAQHAAQFSTFIAGHLVGENIVRNDDDTFTAYGQKATYLKDNFTSGDRAWLEVVSNTYASADA